MVVWHGFFSESTKVVVKAIEYTKGVASRYHENLKSTIEAIHHREIDVEKTEIIDRLDKIKSFILETENRTQSISSIYIREVQEEIKCVLETYLLSVNDTLIKIESPALLKEKIFIKDLLKGDHYSRYDGTKYLKYLDVTITEEKDIFISYSSLDKLLAGEISEILKEKYGFITFLAHETLEISSFWRNEILKHLENCHGILAIVTDNFVDSCWTHQEIGYGIAKEKPIFSLLYTDKKLGFIEAIQGIKMEIYKIEDALDLAYQFMK